MKAETVTGWCAVLYGAPIGILGMVGVLITKLVPGPIGTLLACLWCFVAMVPALFLSAAIGVALIPVLIFAGIFGK